ncbi:MAG: FAD-binding protein [Aureispira sp.]|nr:FAD-binding protein [Aureispira sp.]
MYSKIDTKIIEELGAIVGQTNVQTTKDILKAYGHDETEDFVFLPEVVVIPNTVGEVSKIMRLCNQQKIPVTPRGAGTGLAGGALPVCGGILLSMERFNKILNIDEQNLQITTETAVITEVLQNAVKEKGLYYPPDPASKGTCYIGGNINTNSGGPHAVKYGVVKDYVLNLEVVLPNGEVIWTGANTLKNSTGYNLTQLMVGSEGTLGIVTKAVLKLIPQPSQSLLLLIPFESPESACAAVSAIFRAGITPSCLEFMERRAIEYALVYLGDMKMMIPDEVQAHLLLEVDGYYIESLYEDCEQIAKVVEGFGAEEILFADNDAQKRELWRLRKCVGRAVKKGTIYKEEDTVVPRAELPKLLKGVKMIGQNYGFESVCYGHAGDGNLHVNIVKGELTEQQWNEELPKAITEIFELVKSLGGTISGEHGIGWVQRPYMPIVFGEVELGLMSAIKNVFDPNNILNPQKIF